MDYCMFRVVRKNGAEGGTRTPMGCPTRPSNVRVYQFHHFGTVNNVSGAELTGTSSQSVHVPEFSAPFAAAVLLFHSRFLMHSSKPVSMPTILPVHDVEKCRLQFIGYRPPFTGTD